MNLEDLRKHVHAVKESRWCGQQVWLRKLSAADHIELFGRIKDASAQPLSPDEDRAATLAFHVNLVARSWCDESGALMVVSDEDRKLLAMASFTELCELGSQVLAYSGYQTDGAPEKKS
jgi:hypothetical protein